MAGDLIFRAVGRDGRELARVAAGSRDEALPALRALIPAGAAPEGFYIGQCSWEAAHAGCRDYLGAYSSAHAAGECRPYREMARAAGTPGEDK